jgi:alpha-galactosidase
MTGRRQTVVLIGAGSVTFTQVLVADFARTAPPGGLRLALVDTNPDALDVVARLVRRMVDLLRADVEVVASPDRRDLLPGADVVVTTISVGGRRAWEQDVFIPRRYGVFQPVGDTAMPGGISRAARMIPALVAIARDVRALCPDALFFNYANPMSANCLAIRRATGAPVIGLCHGTFRTERYLAALAGVPEAEAARVASLGVGINHFTFLLDLRNEGVDLLPAVRRALAEEERTGRLTHPFSWELFERWDAYPAPGDRHIVEFVPERFPGGRYYGTTLGVDAFPFEGTIASGDERYARSVRQAAGELPFDESHFPKAASSESEQLARMVDAIRRDSRQVFYVNAPNEGACPQLPPGALLELPAVATGRGFRTLQVGALPPGLAALLARRAGVVELTVQAALRGAQGLFVEAVLADGAVTDPQRASRMVDELLRAQAPFLEPPD